VKRYIKIYILSILSIVILLSTVNCAPSVSQKEYDSVKSELSDAKGQIATLQLKSNEAMTIEAQYDLLKTQYEELNKQNAARSSEIETIKTEYGALNTKYEQLKSQYDVKNSEMQTLQTKYDALSDKFQKLQTQYDTVVQGSVNLDEEEIDQAIFRLINDERTMNGVAELLWGRYLYTSALQNSREMAETGRYQYSEVGAVWQDIFWAVSYGTVEQVANAALTSWKVNDYKYQYDIINPGSIYGAVGTYKLGGIYYITYLTSIYE
jgi:uncharacterized protein YkwD